MIKAAEYALSGLLNASQKFESAARDIAGNPDVSNTFDTISENSGNTGTGTGANTNQGGNLPQPPLASDVSSFQDPPTLAESAVSLKEAEISYKANAAVIKAVQDTEDKVLEILA